MGGFFFSKYTVIPPYPQVSHPRIQLTADWKQYFGSMVGNLWMLRANLSYTWIFNYTPNPYAGQVSTVICITGVNVPETSTPSMPCGKEPCLITLLNIFSAYLAQWPKHFFTTIAIIYWVPTNSHNNPMRDKYHCSHCSDEKTEAQAG